MPTIGELRERITFQARGANENGDLLGDWEAGFTVWAKALARTGSEAVLQARLQGVQPVEFTVRASSQTRPLTTANRIVWRGTPYNIKAVTPAVSRDFIAFLATADQSDA